MLILNFRTKKSVPENPTPIHIDVQFSYNVCVVLFSILVLFVFVLCPRKSDTNSLALMLLNFRTHSYQVDCRNKSENNRSFCCPKISNQKYRARQSLIPDRKSILLYCIAIALMPTGFCCVCCAR